MPEKPILIFPMATVADRHALPPGFPPRPSRPSQAQQRERLEERFDALSRQFGSVQTEIEGIDPEQVIVLETVGSLKDFQNVTRRISGMEWLGDFDTEIEAEDPGFLADGSDATTVAGRLFVVASNRSAYEELLRLWNQWTRAANEKLPRNFGALAEAFKYLNDVRPWGPADRTLATGVVHYWDTGLSANTPTIRFEVELWSRGKESARNGAYDRVKALAESLEGQCIRQSQIPSIAYHGVLMELPATVIRDAVTSLRDGTDMRLLHLTDVKCFAPMGQASIAAIPDGETIAPQNRPIPTGEPVAALFDGLPLSNHAMLQDRVQIDDPDDMAQRYGAAEHRHGTAMASLIAHGELDAERPSIESKIYVRPVMCPGAPDINNRRWEGFPSDELPVDLVHRAVRRMFEGSEDSPPAASNIKIINLSLGDTSKLFDRHLSPWARLLDWLSWEYGVLFIVSAGNHLEGHSIPVPRTAVAELSDSDMRAHTLRSMANQRLRRRLLAPAEAINALTVGGLHDQDQADTRTGHLIDLLRQAPLPSPFNPVASGFRRGIKPEILVPAGRRHYAARIGGTNAEFEISNAAAQPGQLVASPGGNAVPPNHAVRTSGTSNAAALTTRRAIQLTSLLDILRSEADGHALDEDRTAVILKAMLVHGASWGNWQAILDQVFDGPDDGQQRWRRIKRACAQFLGYGPVDFDRGNVCSDQRVIMLGSDQLEANKAHVYRIPLPPALHAQTVSRRLTITLAWLSPTNPRHRQYRAADLWFDPPCHDLRMSRRDADHDSVTRGTIQHEILEGRSAIAINMGDTIPIQVNCRPDGTTRLPALIPYALMVSLEVAEPIGVSIYDQSQVAMEALREASRVRISRSE